MVRLPYLLLLVVAVLQLLPRGAGFLHPVEPHLTRTGIRKPVDACGVDPRPCLLLHEKSVSSSRFQLAALTPSVSVAGEIVHQIPVSLNLEAPVLRAISSTVSTASRIVSDVSSRVVPRAVSSAYNSLRSSVLPPLLSRAVVLASPLLWRLKGQTETSPLTPETGLPLSIPLLPQSALLRAATAKAITSSPRSVDYLLRADEALRRFLSRVLPRRVGEKVRQMQLGRFVIDHASNLADIYAANAIAKSTASMILDGSEVGSGSHKYLDLAERLSYTLYAGYAASSAYNFATDVARATEGSEMNDSRTRSQHFAADRTVHFAIGATTALASANAIATATDSSVTSLLAVGGLSSAAVALASKDVSSNLVGGAMMLANRPLAIGDHIIGKLGGVEISGTVAGVGLLQTRLINKEGRVVYVPNALFLQVPITNSNRTMEHDEATSYCASSTSFRQFSAISERNALDLGRCSKNQESNTASQTTTSFSDDDEDYTDYETYDSDSDSDYSDNYDYSVSETDSESDYSDSESDYDSDRKSDYSESESESESDYSESDYSESDSDRPHSEAESESVTESDFSGSESESESDYSESDSETDYSEYDYSDSDTDKSNSESDYSNTDTDTDTDKSGSESDYSGSDSDYSGSESDYSDSDYSSSGDDSSSDNESDLDDDDGGGSTPPPAASVPAPAVHSKVKSKLTAKTKPAPSAPKSSKSGGGAQNDRIWGKYN